MGDRPQAEGSRTAATIGAGAFGAVVATAASVALRTGSSLRALQALAVGCLLLAALLHIRRTRNVTPTRVPDRNDVDLSLVAAACSAGFALFWLAPWAAGASTTNNTPTLPTAQADRAWLCNVSLLSAPYGAPITRALIAAAPSRAPLLELCASERIGARVPIVSVNPTARLNAGGLPVQSARSLARRANEAPYDLILTAPVTPLRATPLGVLPYADAPLETLEGIHDLLAGLTPTGVLSATLLGEPETLRWLRMAHSALATFEGAMPERQLVVYGAGGAYTVIARRTPFDTNSFIAMHIAQRRPTPPPPPGLAHEPVWLRTRSTLVATAGSAFDNRIADELRSKGGLPPGMRYAFELRPATDDWPLFFELTRLDRPDTWSSAGWYWGMAASLPLAALFALALAWFTTSRTSAPAAQRVRLIGAYGCLAFAHALGYAYVQQRAGLWLPRPLEAPALCATALGASAGVWVALSNRQWRLPNAAGVVLQLSAGALLAALAAIRAPNTSIAARLGETGMAWLALSALALLGLALALAATQLLRAIPQSLRPATAAIYVAALAPAVLLGPALVLVWGYPNCAWCAGGALALAAVLGPIEQTLVEHR